MSKCVLAVLLSSALGAGPAGTDESRLVRVDLNSGPGGGFGNLYLLAQTAVQEDLRLTPEQREQVRDVVRELVEKQQAFTREKDPGRRKELADEAVQFRLRHDRLAPDLLDPTQAERLKQLSLQFRTTASFWDPEVRAALKITDEQFGRIKTIATEKYSEWNRETEAAFRKDKDFPAYQKGLAENRARRDREEVRVLTPEQQAKWNQMLGDPFSGPIPSPILIPVVAQAPPRRRLPLRRHRDGRPSPTARTPWVGSRGPSRRWSRRCRSSTRTFAGSSRRTTASGRNSNGFGRSPASRRRPPTAGSSTAATTSRTPRPGCSGRRTGPSPGR